MTNIRLVSPPSPTVEGEEEGFAGKFKGPAKPQSAIFDKISEDNACLGSRVFTAMRADKHTLSSDDESDSEGVLRLSTSRKRRRTMSVVSAKMLSPSLDSDSSDGDMPLRLPSKHLLSVSGSAPTTVGPSSMSFARRHRRRRSIVPEADKAARQRCFDYLLSGIDVVWAEYCDSTSHAEFQLYMPCSPISEGEPEPEVDADTVCSHGEPASEQPQSQRLGRLKRRLMDAKYFMDELVSSNDADSSCRFWKRWDALKSAVVELVEGDDDDADAVVDELEEGRHF